MSASPDILAPGRLRADHGLVHTVDDEAMEFYQHYGFVLSLLGERVMLLPTVTAIAALMD